MLPTKETFMVICESMTVKPELVFGEWNWNGCPEKVTFEFLSEVIDIK